MSDVRLFNTDDGGDIRSFNGQIELTDGPETAAYLSMFGGNEDDNGTDATADEQWWGNIDEPDPVRQYRCETEAIIRNLPTTTENLRLIQGAAERDLAWFVDEGYATFVDVIVTMPRLNTVEIAGRIEIDGESFPFVFTEDWRQAQQET